MKNAKNDKVPRKEYTNEFRDYVTKMNGLARLAGLSESKKKNHPIFQHLSNLDDLLSRQRTDKGIQIGPIPNDPMVIVNTGYHRIEALAAYGNDRMYWLADGYFEKLMTNPKLSSFISSRLPSPDLYLSVIAELQQWGYLEARELFPILVQDKGMPDLKFGEKEDGGPYHFEVKTIQSRASPKAIKRHISKANNQIKNVGDEAKGGCFIRILGPVSGGYQDDAIPEPFIPYQDEVLTIINSAFYKSVSKIVLTWEEISCMGNIPGWQTWCVARKSKIYSHQQARVKFDINKDFSMKSTCATNILIGNEKMTPIWDVRTENGGIKTVKRK